MAVKIRLARRGRKKLALYDIVVADARAPRDGRFIAKIGSYNPNTTPALVEVQEEVALRWLLNGAQPTDTVKSLLSDKGVLLRKHLQVGVLKGAVTQESADERYNVWLSAKDAKLGRSSDTRLQAQTDQAKARFSAEVKRNENRAEAIRIKNTPPAPEPVAQEPVIENTAETQEAQTNQETQETPTAQ